MKFAVAVLLGFVSQTEAIQFRPNAVQSPWSVAAPAKPAKVFGPNGGFMDGYVRALPTMYSEESDDRLMNSLIMKYSTEETTDGEPNGVFFLAKKNAM